MSHSQFHSLNLFILTHAWLNLCDKHMTTGRINQVAFLNEAAGRMSLARPFRYGEVQGERSSHSQEAFVLGI